MAVKSRLRQFLISVLLLLLLCPSLSSPSLARTIQDASVVLPYTANGENNGPANDDTGKSLPWEQTPGEARSGTSSALPSHLHLYTEGSGPLSGYVWVNPFPPDEPDPGVGWMRAHLDYPAGTVVTLKAWASDGYAFSYWSGDIGDNPVHTNPITITTEDHKSITAHFERLSTYELAIWCEPQEGGNVRVYPSSDFFRGRDFSYIWTRYEGGTEVVITPVPAEGYAFTGWSGDASGEDDPLIVKMIANKDITANFTRVAPEPAGDTAPKSPESCNLGVRCEPQEGGYVILKPGEDNKWQFVSRKTDIGSEVTVTAFPAEGYAFAGWSGDVAGAEKGDNPLRVTMHANTNIVANFKLTTYYSLTVETTDGGSVTISSPNGLYKRSLGKQATGKIPAGTEFDLLAVPEPGYEFTGWTGDVVLDEDKAGNPLHIKMLYDREVKANFKPVVEGPQDETAPGGPVQSFNLLVFADPPEGGFVFPIAGQYKAGTKVEVSATAIEGYKFTGWSGRASGMQNPLSVTMDTHKSITANFKRIVPLDEDGPVDTPPGDDDGYINQPPEGGYPWEQEWGEPGSGRVPGADRLHIYTEGSGPLGGYVSASPPSLGMREAGIHWMGGHLDYSRGTEVTLEAWPSSGYNFSYWSGDIGNNPADKNPIRIAMDGDKSITAHFERVSIYELTVWCDPKNGGTVQVSPSSELLKGRSFDYFWGKYEGRTEVDIEAIPAAGYVFTGWSGDASGKDNPLTVKMLANKDITANFEPASTEPVDEVPPQTEETRMLLVAVDPPGTGLVSPSGGMYKAGTQLNLQAVPAPGYVFYGWTGWYTGTQNPLPVTMDIHKSFTAHFKPAAAPPPPEPTGPVLTVSFTANAVSEFVDLEQCRSSITIAYNARDMTGGTYPVTAVELYVNGDSWDTKAGLSQVVYQSTKSRSGLACGQAFEIFLVATNSEGITASTSDTIVTPIP